MRLNRHFKNQKGSALLQTMVAAAMVVTLSASLTTLNIGRGKAAIQGLRKAAAIVFLLVATSGFWGSSASWFGL